MNIEPTEPGKKQERTRILKAWEGRDAVTAPIVNPTPLSDDPHVLIAFWDSVFEAE